MTDSNVTALPSSIVLDLDAAERPAKDVKPPFVFVIAEREIAMLDPADIDWRDLLLMDNPTEFLRLSLSREDREFLLAQDIPGWKFNQLMETYYNHYDLDEQLRTARRQQALGGV